MKSKRQNPKKDKPLIKSTNQFPVVGIGASAGGMDAIKKFIKAIPENSGMAYIFVQHLAPSHESVLPELLQKVTAMPLHEISDNIRVEPDHIFIIPANKLLVANDGVLQLSPRPPKDQRSMPIDIFFTSLAEVHGSHAIGVVLSGTGTDGTEGLKAIKDQGGITFAQDEASAAFEGMPNNAVGAGVVDFILSPEEIPKKIAAIKNQVILSDEELQKRATKDDDLYKQIISLLRVRRGTDFTYYKQTTIRRRILRRMAISKTNELSDYLNYFRESKAEQDILYQDFLIPVTSFFRDHAIFDFLCDAVFPNIEKAKSPDEPIRIWVAGCSTGQEAYSIAMCLKEYLGDAAHQPEAPVPKVQIFATDISEPAIAKARTGIYTKDEVKGITPQRLQEFFTKIDGSYQLNKFIRDLCVFAVHNFLKDPPFGKVDLVSCRNVLIYLEPYLQKKALTAFHYALNPKSYLLLGKAETTASVSDLFAPVGKSDKLFIRKDIPGRFMHTAAQPKEQNSENKNGFAKTENIRTDFQKTAEDILLRDYTPAGVIVNEEVDIVHFWGRTIDFLELPPGKASFNLLKMARNGLAFELRNILHKAKKDKTTAVKEAIPVVVNSAQRYVTIEAIPLPNVVEPHYLILFRENAQALSNGQQIEAGQKGTKDDRDIRIQQLEAELLQLREDMRTVSEDQEAANEELQSANEELLSGSEELQSLNEELETSKEELQSTNEELTIVNQEMISLNEQIREARNYAEAIVSTIREPLLVLDKNLRVKSANRAFYKTFHVAEQETEGVYLYELGNGQWNIPELRTLLEKILPKKTKFAEWEVRHHFQHIGQRVMLLNASEMIKENNSEKLILLAIEDVTEQTTARKKIEEAQQQLQNIFSQAPAAIALVEGPEHKYVLANYEYQKIANRREDQMVGKVLKEVFPEMEGQGIYEVLNDVHTSGKPFTASEYPVAFYKEGEELEQHYFKFIAEPVKGADGKFNSIMILAIDVTENVEARKKIEESEKRYDMMVMQSPFAFAVLKGKDMIISLANDSVKEMWGKGTEIEGKSLTEVLPEIKDQGFPELLHEVYTTGIPYTAYEVLARLMRNGIMEDVYFNFVYQPYREADGTIAGVTIIATEVTPQVMAKKQIAESEKRYHELISSSSSMISILKGEELIVEIANDAILETWGKGADVIRKPFLEVLPELIEQGLGDVLHNVYTTGKAYHAYEMPIRLLRNGSMELSYYNFVYEPQRNLSGEITGIAIIANEVTPQAILNKKIKESEEHFRTMADLMPAKISNANPNGDVTYFNKQWLDFSGYTFEELKDFGYHKMMHPDEIEEFGQRLQKAAATGTVLEMEMRFLNKEGAYIWHLNLAAPVKDEDGKIKMWVGVTTEIQTQKEQEQELEKAVQERTVELHDASEALYQKNEELIKINHELESFNYISSHDLQEPLRKIRTFAARILEKEYAALSDIGKDYFQRMNNAAARMQTLIEDLLDYSHASIANRKLEKTDLTKIVEEVKEELTEAIQQKSAVLEVGQLCQVPINTSQLRQLVHNLISNALKFSKPGLPSHIIISSETGEGGHFPVEKLVPGKTYCHISFSDNGIGFDPEYKDKIFEVFQRLHGKEAYEGTGIGLAIVKKIVENHNGIITATGEPGKGARFDIYIPT